MAALPPQREALDAWIAQGIALWPDVQEMGRDLKDAAHAALYQDLARSERLASALIRLGEQREEEGLIALGEMALGDALRLQRRLDEGYQLLDQAAARFERIGDEVGWARTRIGWLGHIHQRESYPPLAPIVERAATIFERHHCWGWLSTLCCNFALYWQFRSQRDEQLAWTLRAQEAAERIEGAEARFQALRRSRMMLLTLYNSLGHYEKAQALIPQLLALFEGERATSHLYVEVLVAVGHFYLQTGRYTQALYYLYQAERRAEREEDELIAAILIAFVYRRLNRLEESEALLVPLLARLSGRPEWRLFECDARFLLSHLLAAREQWEEALAILEPALAVMEGLPGISAFWMAEAYQQQARLLYQLGRHERLPELVAEACRLAKISAMDYGLAEAHLLAARVAPTPAAREAAMAEALASCSEIPWLRWYVYYLAAELVDRPERRQAMLAKAADDLDSVQSSLAASFHADYLKQAGSLYQSLIACYLEQGEAALAWQTLERAKSRALINTMLYQQERQAGPSSPLTAELEQLQLRHYGLIKAQLEGRAGWEEIHAVEAEMEALQELIEVEMLGRREPLSVPPPIIPAPPPDSDLVGYYLVDEEVHAFVHNGTGIAHRRLPTTPSELEELNRALFVNMRTVAGVPESWVARLTGQLHQILERLDALLLAPLRPLLRHEQLLFVPHGLLHQTPFHLLRHKGHYLLEHCAPRVLPTARLVERREGNPAAQRTRVVVSHSWGGKLPKALEEGRMVAEILGKSTLLEGEGATKRELTAQMPHASLLHIAAHGEHRADAPHFSHIQLEDGQLNFSDLFLLSLRASLVTLSACDTGQVVVQVGDDPIGLWRGFLAAGAQTLLVSLWQLEDASALQLMRHFYERLVSGTPKVAALRSVQQAWLAEAEGRFRHPFYWGALQLIGDDGPLDYSGDL